ncbi:MAG TPA: pyrroline-5-carboxylate reductase [Flavobacterium sp.]|nr:pyrroline-5-carboxylate reductase [Flavobacterium sp.]
MSKSLKIAILGGGNIGMAIAEGLLYSGKYKASDIVITRLPSQSLSDLQSKGFTATFDNNEAVRMSHVIILAVQPRQYKYLLEGIKGDLNNDQHILVSVVSAVTIDEIEDCTGEGLEIVRIMPNTAVSICESMTCITARDTSSDKFIEVKSIFENLGEILVIDEKLMAAATVLGACGIAFFLRVIRAASQGGIQVGFHANEAQLIAAQTAKGATALLLKTGKHPEEEIDKVTTPLGLTIKGLNEMEHHGLSSAIIKGIVHSYQEIDKLNKPE